MFLIVDIKIIVSTIHKKHLSTGWPFDALLQTVYSKDPFSSARYNNLSLNVLPDFTDEMIASEPADRNKHDTFISS